MPTDTPRAPAGPLRVLVLGGGPDAEREVSLRSARAVADALAGDAAFAVHHAEIDRVTRAELAGQVSAARADVVFPVLHGRFGEGGPLQDLLESVGVAYVGCRPAAARLAMDKFASKLCAAAAGVPTLPAAILNRDDDAPPIALPCVVKPVHEGSSVGLHLCRDDAAWRTALTAVRGDRDRVYMVERLVDTALGARELTVGVLTGEGAAAGALSPLPIIEIRPAAGPYDYAAKYTRGDTQYLVGPDLPAGVAARVSADAGRVAAAVGVRHLSRVDFLLDPQGRHWFLEINTMPGFTATSLLPKAAAGAGLGFGGLVARLVRAAFAAGPPARADNAADLPT